MVFQSIFFFTHVKRDVVYTRTMWPDVCVRIVLILSPLILSGLAVGLRLNDPIFVRQNIHPGLLFFREKAYKTQTDRRKTPF